MSEEFDAKQKEPTPRADLTPIDWRSPLTQEIVRRLQAGRAAAASPLRRSTSAAPVTRRTWRRLLDGDLADQARASVLAIADAVRRESEPEARGPCGLALLYGYLAAEGGAAAGSYAALSRDFLDGAIAHTSEPAGLYEGFVGTAWTVEHLSGGNPDANRSLDALLLRFLRTTPWPGHLDLTLGLAGIGIYAIERARRPIARQCLSLVVDRLAEQAEWRDGGVTWLSRAALMLPETKAEFPLGHYNCGVAHGVPAPALVLAGACRVGVNVGRARPLLDGAMRWMLANRLEADSPSAFPYHVAPDRRDSPPARSAWCYGDPGVAATLLAVAGAVGEQTWGREALALARRASARPMDECGVFDAGLCHGAAGLALLYNRMWQTTGDEALRVAAIGWCQRTLELRRIGVGVAGYQTYNPGAEPADNDDPWKDDTTFLTGATGIALALLAAISDVEPAWDVVLAASLPAAVTAAGALALPRPNNRRATDQ